jgi:hypothetical protein
MAQITRSKLSMLSAVAIVSLSFGAPLLAPAAANAGDASGRYTLEVHDVVAKVGEPAVLSARLTVREGLRILHAYNNRLVQLSSFDDGVAFDGKMVPGTDEDGTLVFSVGVRPTKPGKHAINGVVRFGYIEGTDDMAMISVPVIANVTGTE